MPGDAKAATIGRGHFVKAREAERGQLGVTFSIQRVAGLLQQSLQKPN
jgi:hypothetical protein